MPPAVVVTLVGFAAFALLFVRRLGGIPLSRPVTAATGAVVLLAIGAITPEAALESIDSGTLLILFGMLVHVEALSRSGFYEWAAARLVLRATTERRLTLLTLLISACLAALTLNDAVVLLMTPILVRAVSHADVDPAPPVLAVVIGANIGSTATPVGNPQNAYVLSQSPLTPTEFVTVLGPVALLCLVATGVLLVYRLPVRGIDAEVEVPELDRGWTLVSWGFLALSFALLVAFPGSPGTVVAGVAVIHAAILQPYRGVSGDEVIEETDWGIIVLFVGMFVIVGALEGTPLVQFLTRVNGGWELAGATFLLSNLVSNVPATVILATSVGGKAGWYVLAAVGTLAGNASPVGSAAMLIALDQADRAGVEISLGHLVRVGLPIAAVTSFLATATVLLLV